jgi:hypothetical protein
MVFNWWRGLMLADSDRALFEPVCSVKKLDLPQLRRPSEISCHKEFLAVLLMRSTAFQLRYPPWIIARKIFSRWLEPVLLVLACGQFAAAQEESGSDAALRAEQQKLFD